jgi:hypothetical protein
VRSSPGREAQAKQVLADALQYCDGLQRAGRIDSFDVVVLEPHGGDLGGFALLKGDKCEDRGNCGWRPIS